MLSSEEDTLSYVYAYVANQFTGQIRIFVVLLFFFSFCSSFFLSRMFAYIPIVQRFVHSPLLLILVAVVWLWCVNYVGMRLCTVFSDILIFIVSFGIRETIKIEYNFRLIMSDLFLRTCRQFFFSCCRRVDTVIHLFVGY